ncbi:hypothetical protein Sbs19_44520 [Sphingobium sp. BS19]|nr:hypothetical protein Sbs19_44520 [Sphingobium sp. BS19]
MARQYLCNAASYAHDYKTYARVVVGEQLHRYRNFSAGLIQRNSIKFVKDQHYRSHYKIRDELDERERPKMGRHLFNSPRELSATKRIYGAFWQSVQQSAH